MPVTPPAAAVAQITPQSHKDPGKEGLPSKTSSMLAVNRRGKYWDDAVRHNKAPLGGRLVQNNKRVRQPPESQTCGSQKSNVGATAARTKSKSKSKGKKSNLTGPHDAVFFNPEYWAGHAYAFACGRNVSCCIDLLNARSATQLAVELHEAGWVHEHRSHQRQGAPDTCAYIVSVALANIWMTGGLPSAVCTVKLNKRPRCSRNC